MAKLIAFLRKGKEGTQPSTVPPVRYIAVDGSKEKDSVKGKIRAVTRMSSVKKCPQKFSNIQKEIPALESLLNTITGLQPATLSKKKLWYRCFHVSFAKLL